MENEIWKPIDGLEDRYEVSNLGRVRSLVWGVKSDAFHIMKPSPREDGYLRVRLYYDEKEHYVTIHRLVAKAFIENPDHKPCVDHLGGNITNNRATNLRWCTHKENMNNPISIERHSRASKISVPKAWKSGFYKIMPRRVAQLSKEGEIICVWESVSMAARELGLSLGNLFACIWGKRKTCGGYKWEYIEPGKRKNANNRRMEIVRAKLTSK